jgi:hypothetical protein
MALWTAIYRVVFYDGKGSGVVGYKQFHVGKEPIRSFATR